MENSIGKAINSIHTTQVGDTHQLRKVLLQFYQDRTVEILVHLEETGAGKLTDFDNVKIGGTHND